MNYNEILVLDGKGISVLYTKMYETVAKMVLQYYDFYQFVNTVFVVNTLVDENSENVDYRSMCPGARQYIYYQLNNLQLNPEYIALEYMSQFDEIWECNQSNMAFYNDDVKDKVVYMPLRYVDIPRVPKKDSYKYDIGFIGTLTPSRQDMLFRISRCWTDDYCKIKTITGYPYSELYDDISECKYLIDLPRDIGLSKILNSSRILEAVCSGKQILTYLLPDKDNQFTWLTVGYTNIYDITDLVKKDPVDNADVFKDWTTNNKAYEEYRKYLIGDNYKQKLEL